MDVGKEGGVRGWVGLGVGGERDISRKDPEKKTSKESRFDTGILLQFGTSFAFVVKHNILPCALPELKQVLFLDFVVPLRLNTNPV